jgi:hypothetical protein
MACSNIPYLKLYLINYAIYFGCSKQFAVMMYSQSNVILIFVL